MSFVWMWPAYIRYDRGKNILTKLAFVNFYEIKREQWRISTWLFFLNINRQNRLETVSTMFYLLVRWRCWVHLHRTNRVKWSTISICYLFADIILEKKFHLDCIIISSFPVRGLNILATKKSLRLAHYKMGSTRL